MKKLLNWIFAFTLPWLVILLDDNPGGAVLALVMQVTIVGWIPASMWAMQVLNEKSKKKK